MTSCDNFGEFRREVRERQANFALRDASQKGLWKTVEPMDQKIILVTGKGGVGKSVVAAALAFKKAREGFKTLLVELGDESFYQKFFDLPDVTYKPRTLIPNVDVALWSGADCLKEYALYLLKIESLYKLFFENKVSRTLINVAPALPELAILGKVTSGPRRHGPPVPYDFVIVDAYATGHFLSLLRAPGGMAEAIHYGPMGEQSRSIQKTITNPDICKFYLVTLPEDLPMKETEELDAALKSEFKIQGQWILNRVLETPLKSNDLSAPAQGTKKINFEGYLHTVLQRQEKILESIKNKKILSQSLPFLTEEDPKKLVQLLSERLL